MPQRVTHPALTQPRASLSIEVGHFYSHEIMDDLGAVEEQLRSHRPLVELLLAGSAAASTVLMIDDYHTRKNVPPARIMDPVLEAADKADVRVDYIVREGAFIPAAEKMLDDLQSAGKLRGSRNNLYLHDYREDPHEARPMITQVTELGDKKDKWSCPLLAAMFQLERLGRTPPAPGFEIVDIDDAKIAAAQHWDELPPLMRRSSAVEPFVAERTFSILPNEFLDVEAAVRSIMRAATQHYEQPPASVGYAFSPLV